MNTFPEAAQWTPSQQVISFCSCSADAARRDINVCSWERKATPMFFVKLDANSSYHIEITAHTLFNFRNLSSLLVIKANETNTQRWKGRLLLREGWRRCYCSFNSKDDRTHHSFYPIRIWIKACASWLIVLLNHPNTNRCSQLVLRHPPPTPPRWHGIKGTSVISFLLF